MNKRFHHKMFYTANSILLFLFFIINGLNAQDAFVKHYSTDYQANKIHVSFNGDIYITGIGIDASLMKVDSLGNEIWNRDISRPYNGTQIKDILEFGNYIYIVGVTKDTILPTINQNSDNLFICKIDKSSGSIIESKVAGDSLNESLNRVYATSDGNFLAVGSVETSVFPSEYAPIIIKFDSSLNNLWSNAYSTGKIAVFTDIIESDNNFYYALGHELEPAVSESRLVLSKIDTIGNIIFSKYLTEPGSQLFAQEIVFCGKDILISGAYNKLNSSPIFSRYLCKIDTVGNLLWFKSFDIGTPINAGFFLSIDQDQYLMSAGKHIWRMDSTAAILNSNYFDFSIIHGDVATNNKYYCAVRPNLNVLLTDSNLISCDTQLPVIGQIDILTITDSVFQFTKSQYFYTSNSSLYQDVISSNDSLICQLYTSDINMEITHQTCDLLIFPNPAIDELIVRYTNEECITNLVSNKLSVRDIYGRNFIIKSDVLYKEVKCDVSHLDSGIYTIYFEDRIILGAKFLKL